MFIEIVFLQLFVPVVLRSEFGKRKTYLLFENSILFFKVVLVCKTCI